MTASERRPTLGGKESRSCELQVSNGQPSFKSDEHHVEEWSAQCAQRSALMPLRRQREPAGSASPSRWLRLLHRQHSASASRWLRSLAPCMHSATLRQRFALASRAPRGYCHGDRLRILSLCNRSWTLEACRWNLEFKVILNFCQTGLFIQNRSKFIQNRSKSILLL